MTEITIILAALAVLVFVAWIGWSRLTAVVTVWDHEHALHFRHGKLIGLLEAGRHRLWGRGHDVTRLDKRWQEAVIQGQEFLTADKVPVKVSGLVRFRIADPATYTQAATNALATLYSAVQIALRDVIGGDEIENVLEQKANFGAALEELVKPVADRLGYELDAVVVRDLMLTGDLKRVFTAAMTAKQEALAGLETARGEAAAIRVMANAARAFDQHPALLQLRFLKTLETSAGGYNNQLILGPVDPLMSFLKR